jgi:hypothetical protein
MKAARLGSVGAACSTLDSVLTNGIVARMGFGHAEACKL